MKEGLLVALVATGLFIGLGLLSYLFYTLLAWIVLYILSSIGFAVAGSAWAWGAIALIASVIVRPIIVKKD